MFGPRFPLIRLLSSLICVGLTLPAIAQNSTSQIHSTQAGTAATEPAARLRTFSRMVTLEVVVKDKKGKHVTGLKAEDFQIFEQTPGKSKEKREQKIASLREVSVSDLARLAGQQTQVPIGVYTNALAARKYPVPPTILLMDGLNTQVQYQIQVHAQSMKGNPGQFMSIPLNRKLKASETQRVAASGLEDIAAVPGPMPASLRIAVMDVTSGRIASLRIKMDGTAAPPSAIKTAANASQVLR
jgi:hypothetical protein